MDLKTFVAQTLEQVLEGVKTAQRSTHGAEVAPEAHIASQGSFINLGTQGAFTLVEFDVAVVAETHEGGDTVRVSSAEISSGSASSTQTASRVKFSVHVKLPPGSRLPGEASGRGRRVLHDYDPTSW